VTSSTIVTNTTNHTLYAYYIYYNCFTENTLLYTPNGYREIKDLKVGDKVYSYNEKTGEVEEDVISKVMINKTNSYLKVTLEDNTIIEVTGSHPFYDKKSNSWKPISEFEIGDIVTTSENKDIKIKSIESIEKEETVYNLEVMNNHNYFVTESNILVHNKAA